MERFQGDHRRGGMPQSRERPGGFHGLQRLRQRVHPQGPGRLVLSQRPLTARFAGPAGDEVREPLEAEHQVRVLQPHHPGSGIGHGLRSGQRHRDRAFHSAGPEGLSGEGLHQQRDHLRLHPAPDHRRAQRGHRSTRRIGAGQHHLTCGQAILDPLDAGPLTQPLMHRRMHGNDGRGQGQRAPSAAA